jgi:NitT/TauT family transport system permease protein
MDIRFFDPNRTANASAWRVLPNRWDAVAFPLIIGILAMAIVGFHETMAPIATLQTQKISLDPSNLPEYALRTTLRMLAAMVASLVFTLGYGTLAAKSRRAGMVLIPILDILQSVPVLGLSRLRSRSSRAVSGPRARRGARRDLRDLHEPGVEHDVQLLPVAAHGAARSERSVARLPPDAVAALLEARSAVLDAGPDLEHDDVDVGRLVLRRRVGGDHRRQPTITLPGIGAYLAQAIADKNLAAVGWVIVAMSVVILAYDQLLFRPLVAWADKFRMENTASGDAPQSWLLDLMRRTHLIHQLLVPAGWLLSQAARIPLRAPSVTLARSRGKSAGVARRRPRVAAVVIALTLYVAWRVVGFVATGVTLAEVGHVLVLGLITLLRVLVLIAIASVVWVPLGVLIGLRPKLAEKIQPLAQFLAAFPANLLFPVFVIVIVHFHLNPDIWLSPLIVLGTQWYILFNVIAGATSYPNDYKEARRTSASAAGSGGVRRCCPASFRTT